jgi:hypothetical protein
MPEGGEHPVYINPNNIVAIVATLDEVDINDNYLNQVVLVDINNPELYKFVGEKTTRISFLTISSDGTKLAYVKGEHNSQQEIMIYDIRADDYYSIDVCGNVQPVRSYFTSIKWNYQNTGVYYNKRTGHSYNLRENSIKYYNLNSQKSSTIIDGGSVRINSLIDRNHFLGWSEKSLSPNRYAGFYVVSISGNVIMRINTSFLQPRDAYFGFDFYPPVSWLDMNSDKGLFVGRLFSEDKIVVFNLDGSYYREYDTGQSGNIPVWSMDGKEIFLECEDFSPPENSYLNRKIMLLDPKSGEVREFLSPEDIESVYNLSLYGLY